MHQECPKSEEETSRPLQLQKVENAQLEAARPLDQGLHVGACSGEREKTGHSADFLHSCKAFSHLSLHTYPAVNQLWLWHHSSAAPLHTILQSSSPLNSCARGDNAAWDRRLNRKWQDTCLRSSWDAQLLQSGCFWVQADANRQHRRSVNTDGRITKSSGRLFLHDFWYYLRNFCETTFLQCLIFNGNF